MVRVSCVSEGLDLQAPGRLGANVTPGLIASALYQPGSVQPDGTTRSDRRVVLHVPTSYGNRSTPEASGCGGRIGRCLAGPSTHPRESPAEPRRCAHRSNSPQPTRCQRYRTRPQRFLAADGRRTEGGGAATGRPRLPAPPNCHLTVNGGAVAPTRGPREHHTRPAIDVLFRTAAREFGPAVTGVLLSGTGADGTAGVMAVRNHGGRIVVQAPSDATHAAMPLRAAILTNPDHMVRAEEIAPLLANLMSEKRGNPTQDASDPARATIEHDIAAQQRGERTGVLSTYSCPDCGGTLWQVDQGGVIVRLSHGTPLGSAQHACRKDGSARSGAARSGPATEGEGDAAAPGRGESGARRSGRSTAARASRRGRCARDAHSGSVARGPTELSVERGGRG